MATYTPSKFKIVKGGNTYVINTSPEIASFVETMSKVSQGNTHEALAQGEFVYIFEHSSLTEGMYTANAAIAANGALTSSNVTTVSSGALNSLFAGKANKAGTVLTSTLSCGRRSGSTVGTGSFAFGENVEANHKSQYVFGENNVADGSANASTARGNYVEIVGNGTASNSTSNARALDWNGNERLKGDLYVGCNADSTGGSKVATEAYALDLGAITPATAIQIPAAGSSASYDLAGITASYILFLWRFSTNAENDPPTSLSYSTYDGYVTITNHGSTSPNQTIQPVFIKMRECTVSAHSTT